MRKRTACVQMFRNDAFVPAGLIEVTEDGRFSSCRFRYFDEYIERRDAVAVDPVSLPLHNAAKRVFEGPRGGDLFGGIEDACPDSWGQHVLTSAAEDFGITLTAYDYMLYAGPERIGGLGFSEKKDEAPFTSIPLWARNISGSELNLEEMLLAADKVDFAEKLEPRYRRFFVRGSSLGGARPKAAIEYDGQSCIAKFGAIREMLPTCRLEHATRKLADLCGIRTVKTQVVTVFGNRDILLAHRFDRENGVRKPFISALTLLGRSSSKHENPASYSDIAFAMRRHCRADDLHSNLAELFARMTFNICCNNNDDHLRNHGFLYEEGTGKNGWRLSPSYDVVPQPRFDNSLSQLSLGVGIHGRTASFENALSSCAHFGLSLEEAASIVERIKGTICANWEKVMLDAGVPTSSLPVVRKSFKAVFND